MATQAQINLLVNTASSGRTLRDFEQRIDAIQTALQSATNPADVQRLQQALATATVAGSNFSQQLEIIGRTKFEAAALGMQSISAGFQTAQAAAALFGAESEELEETLVKVSSAMALTEGLGQLANAPRILQGVAQSFGLITPQMLAYNLAQQTSAVAAAELVAAEATLTTTRSAAAAALIQQRAAQQALLIAQQQFAAGTITQTQLNAAQTASTNATTAATAARAEVTVAQTAVQTAQTAATGANTALTNINTRAVIANQIARLGLAGLVLAGAAALIYGGYKLYEYIKGEEEAKLATDDLNKSLDAQTRAAKALFDSPLFKGDKVAATAAVERNAELLKLERQFNDDKAKIQEDDKKTTSQKNLEIQNLTTAYLDNRKAIEQEYQNKILTNNKEVQDKGTQQEKDDAEKRKAKREQAFQDEIAAAEANMEFKKAQYKTEEELNSQSLIDELELINAKIKIAKKFGKDTTALELERKKTIQKINFENAKSEEKNAEDTKTANEKDLKDREDRYSKEEKAIDRQLALKKAAYKTEKELADNSTKDEIEAIEQKIAARQKEGLEVADLLVQLAQLKQKAAFDQIKSDEEAIANAPDYMNLIFGIKSSDEISKMTPKEKAAAIIETVGNTFSSLNDTIQGFYELRLQELEQQKQDELDLFDAATEAELAGVVKGSEQEKSILQRRQLEREKLERDADKKARGIQKEQALFQNRVTLLQAIAQGAAATINAFNLGGPALAILVGAAVVAQIELIRAQGEQINKIKAAKGGLLTGPSHSEGGISGTGVFSNIEVEGGEFIVNKEATRRNLPLLSAINRNSFEPNATPVTDNTSLIAETITSMLAQPLKAYVVETEIQEVRDKREFIERRTTIN